MDEQNSRKNMDEEESVSLSRLSLVTGFPQDFISRELLLDQCTGENQNSVSLKTLRESMIKYLNKNF